MNLELAGKVAIVTGSSRGIGRAIATRLTEEGADVVFCARGEDALRVAVAETRGPGRAFGVVADVSVAEGAAAVVRAAEEEFGGLDVVVNNVGGSGARTFDDMDTDDLAAVLDKNVVPALRVSRAALPSLRARGGGVIAVIASVFGRESGGGPSYNLAKAAEISLAKSMARDLAKDGIRVFSVAPGSTRFPGGELGPANARRPRRHDCVRRAGDPLGSPRDGRRDRGCRDVPGLAAGVVGGRGVRSGRRRPVTRLLTSFQQTDGGPSTCRPARYDGTRLHCEASSWSSN